MNPILRKMYYPLIVDLATDKYQAYKYIMFSDNNDTLYKLTFGHACHVDENDNEIPLFMLEEISGFAYGEIISVENTDEGIEDILDTIDKLHLKIIYSTKNI